MMSVTDPVGQGIVASLARPGGNITGVIEDETAQIAAKRLQLLKDAVPRITQVAALIDPDNNTRAVAAAGNCSAILEPDAALVAVRQASEFERAFAALERDRPDALFVASSGLNLTNRTLIMELAAKSRLPAASNFRETTGARWPHVLWNQPARSGPPRRAMSARFPKRAKPGDLPVEQPTRYELVINLKTAKALDLEIPRPLLLIADEVIE